MNIGYEGFVKVADIPLLAKSASIPLDRIRLDSSAGYGGQIKTPRAEIGIGLPYNFDWSVNDGSINFDVETDSLWGFLLGWPGDRQNDHSVKIKTRKDNVQEYDQCFWSKINYSASEGSPLNCTLNFVSVERSDYDYGKPYIENVLGEGNLCVTGELSPLNPSNENKFPIPYWKTAIEVEGDKKDFVNWSLVFAQDVKKFFTCEHNADPVEPRYIAVGPMTVSFSGSFIFNESFLGESLTDMRVWLYYDLASPTYYYDLLRLEDMTDRDEVAAPSSLVPLTCEYVAYEIDSSVF